VFEYELRMQIETSHRGLAIARREDLPYEAYLHRARLEDLFELAERHGVDVEQWIDRSSLPPLTLSGYCN
jgi:hypothetical protein